MGLPTKADFVCFYDINWNGSRQFQMYQAYNGFSSLGKEVSVRWIHSVKADLFEPNNRMVYVSCHYHGHLEIVFKWASKYPDNFFVCGGGLFDIARIRSSVKKIPDNVRLIGDSLQKYFGIERNPWHMEFPYSDKQLRYTFNNSSVCYWQKCNFCIATRRGRPYEDTQYDYSVLKSAPYGRVYLSNPSTPGPILKQILPLLSTYKQNFTLFIRAGSEELNALKSIEPNWTKFYFLIGVEYPSDRMLKIMNKGVTLRECMDMVTFLQSKGAGLGIYMIYDWPKLTKNDLVEAKEFFSVVDKNANVIYRPLYHLRDLDDKLEGWTRFESYKPEMSKRAIEANEMWLKMLREQAPESKTEEMRRRRKCSTP
jgi:radical SAM superfamily enzyme YgiQ (UPF0313 family)